MQFVSLRSVVAATFAVAFLLGTSGCGLVRGAIAAPIMGTKALVKTYKKGLEGYD